MPTILVVYLCAPCRLVLFYGVVHTYNYLYLSMLYHFAFTTSSNNLDASSTLSVFMFVYLKLCRSSTLSVFNFVGLQVCVSSTLSVFNFVYLQFCRSSTLSSSTPSSTTLSSSHSNQKTATRFRKHFRKLLM
jgi:hypothetical protein